jgi:hypothetical protein
MAENNLVGGINQLPGAQYPSFQPMQQPNPLAQVGPMLDIARSAQALQQQDAALGQTRIAAVKNMLGTLITKPDLQFSDVTDRLTDLVRNNVIPVQEMPAILSNMPQDSAGLRAKIKQVYAETLDHSNRMQLGFGAQTAINTGGATQFGRTDPMNPGQPQFAGGTTLPNTMSPGITEGPPARDRTTGAVAPTRITNEQFEGLAKGRYKMGPNGQIIPSGNTAGQAIMGAPAGAAEAAGVAAQGSAGQANTLEASAGGAPIRRGMLNNLEDDLSKFSTGPLAQGTLQAKRLYNQAAGAVGMPKLDEAGVAAHENFNKQATQLAQQQFTALGGTGTDSQLGSAFKANPNDALSNMGNKQIIQMLKGNEDAIAAKNTAWQDWKKKNGADTYGQFQEDWNQNFSPRAFQWVHMSPSERKDLVKNMKPGEKDQLGNALEIAEKRKWISRSQAQ